MCVREFLTFHARECLMHFPDFSFFFRRSCCKIKMAKPEEEKGEKDIEREAEQQQQQQQQQQQ